MIARLVVALCAAFSLAIVSGGAFAQVSASDAAFDRFYAQVTGVGKQTVSYGSGGQLVVGQGVPQISSSGGPVNVDRSIPIRNNSGGQITANARISVPPAVLGRLLIRGMGAASVLGAGVALYDVAQELGYFVAKDESGAIEVGIPILGACTNPAGCTGYVWSANFNFGTVGPTVNPTGQCSAFVGRSSTIDGQTRTVVQAVESGTGCDLRYDSSYGPCCGGWGTASRATVAMTYNPVATTPITIQALEDAIAAKAGWPSGSRVSQAVADATATQPAEPFVATPQVTGPATSTGTTTTTDHPDGSTTTKTTTHNHTYTGPTINTTTTTITSTCTGGSCNSTSETETPKIDDQPFAMPCGVPGTPPCEVSVDETGMKTPDQIKIDQADNTLDEWDSFVTDIIAALPAFPTINWAFSLPTACGVIPLPAFSPMIESIDVCQFQPMFHELMTVVWTLGGLFGAISLFMRSSLSS